MSLFIAAIALLTMQRPDPSSPAVPPTVAPADAASVGAARAWLDLVDRARWSESWQAAGTTFRAQITASQWEAAGGAARRPLGAVDSRRVLTVNNTNALPGLPPGDYAVIQFETRFRDRGEAVETVSLAREGTSWRVIGYFIR